MSTRELSFRHARREDANAIAALVNDAYGRTETPSGWTSEDDILEGPRIQPDEVEAFVEQEASTILVAELDEQADEFAGCAHVQRSEGADASEIGMLSVRPDLQAEGVGRRILERAEDYARTEHGAERALLHVLTVREEVLAWYERRGYEPTGDTKPFEPEKPQVSLVGELRFAVLEKSLDRGA